MSVNGSEPDPLIGQEIIRISLETFEVHLNLTNSQIQIGSDFEVRSAEQGAALISPISKVGQISSLWRSIGSCVEDVIWDASITIKISCGIEIFIPPKPGGIRGSILGVTPDGKGTEWDDF